MRKVAYIITRTGTRELIEGCLLSTVSSGTHGREVVAMHFAEDGVYHLVQGTTTAKKIERAMKEQGVQVLACECSTQNRGLDGMLIEGVPLGHFQDFYEAAGDADVVAL